MNEDRSPTHKQGAFLDYGELVIVLIHYHRYKINFDLREKTISWLMDAFKVYLDPFINLVMQDFLFMMQND